MSKIGCQYFKDDNGAPERTVKLCLDYAAILTENEEQQAMLLKVVEKHQKQDGNYTKLTLAINLEFAILQLQRLQTFPIKTNTLLIKVRVV